MSSRQAGLTMLEMVAASTVLIASLGVMASTMGQSKKAYQSAAARFDATENVRRVLRRISDEIRSGSRWGEDLNDNRVLDVGEDVNKNGRLDRDWAVTPTSLTFNRLLPSQFYDLATTYTLEGTSLLRTQVTSLSGDTVQSELARGITSFQVTQTGDTVDVAVTGSAGQGKSTFTESISVHMRN